MPHEVQRQLYVRPLQQIKIRRPTLRQWFQHLHQQNQESCPLPYHRLYPLCRNGRQRQSVDESIMAIMFTLASMVPFITSHACGMVQTHAIARPCSRWLVVLNTEFIMELTSCWRTSRKTCNNPHRTCMYPICAAYIGPMYGHLALLGTSTLVILKQDSSWTK